MPFQAVVYQHVEEALSESFSRHNSLDSFLRRSGVPVQMLNAARASAENRNQQAGKFQKAPKRYVVQELMLVLERPEHDRFLTDLISNLIKGVFVEASPNGLQAIEELKKHINLDKKEKADLIAEKKRELEEQQDKVEQKKQKAYSDKESQRQELLKEFMLLNEHDNPQQRGFLFETFLNKLFKYADLSPRAPFKNTGEQIDGSFIWKEQTYLLEAKWVKAPVAGNAFASLMYKIEGKTADTRGLFISVNGYSDEAIKGLGKKGELKFICLDGAHIVNALTAGNTLKNVLDKVWRHADETGDPYLTTSRF